MKKTYKITVTDTATYYIKADDMDAAEDLAIEWFGERDPETIITETDEEEDYEI